MNKIIKIPENISCTDEDQELNKLKDLEKEFLKTLKKANKEIQVCLDEIEKCSDELYKIDEKVFSLKLQLENLSEKYEVPVSYSFNKTTYWYTPESFILFKEKFKNMEVSNREIADLMNSSLMYEGWYSSSC
jgi:chromosome segregation ATPase